MNIDDLQVGKHVIFAKVPYLSFLREGIEYIVHYRTDENIYFIHPLSERVTFEDKNDLQYCHWQLKKEK